MRIMAKVIEGVAVALLAVGLTTVPAAGSTASTGLYAPLQGSTAYPTATGDSYYYGGMGMMGSRDVRVTVNHMARLAGQQVAVFLDGARVGYMLVSSTGYAYHRWTGSFVPWCMGGSRVIVRTSGGATLASGAYR